MAHAKQDLWPEIAPVTARTPLTILREQASLLGPKTRNLLEADVETGGRADQSLTHDFVLIAPALGNYRYFLFRASHSVVDPYPVQLEFVEGNKTARDEEEFLGEVEGILKHDSTRKVVDALLSQSVS